MLMKLRCAGARESHQMGTIVPFSFRQNDCHSDTDSILTLEHAWQVHEHSGS